jgi:hypothetical protein
LGGLLVVEYAVLQEIGDNNSRELIELRDDRIVLAGATTP